MPFTLKAKSYLGNIDTGCMEEIFSDSAFSRFNSEQYTLFPGFTDVHVHFREPGFSYKETIKTGSLAAAHGGYTCVCPMPNLKPVPDSPEHLKVEQDIIDRDACIEVLPYGSLTVGQLGEQEADLDGMADKVVAFSDDGKGVQSEDMMRELMVHAKKLNKIVVAHCEVNSLLKGGYIHDGKYAAEHGHRGICSESEWKEIERDCRLAKETGCAYHVCHISTKESVQIIRQAKADGVNVTCETGPHYLVLDDRFLKEDGWFKMNPPIRDLSDREELIRGIQDGTIDMIATDHAPHSAEEKSRGLEKSSFGIVGIETSFQVLYTELVEKGIITLEKLLQLLTVNPEKRFGISTDRGFSIWDLNEKTVIDPDSFLSMGKATPFAGMKVDGVCKATVYGGFKRIW